MISYIIPLWANTSVADIEASLNSLLAEIHLISEIILVYDGNSPSSIPFKVTKPINDKLCFVYLPSNKGPGISRNCGAVFSTTKYIFFLDSGDCSSSNRISKQLPHLSRYDAVYGTIREYTNSISSRLRYGCKSLKVLNSSCAWRSPFNNVTLAIRREVFLNMNGYPPQRTAEDWIFSLKLVANGFKIIDIDDVLVSIYLDKGFISRRRGFNVTRDIVNAAFIAYKSNFISIFTLTQAIIYHVLVRLMLPPQILRFAYNFARRSEN